jgi:riboflavin kinase / FMN adenylyltransferase
MQIYNSLTQLPDFQNTVITIGSFDGVHCGHQKILEQVKSLAKEVKGESVVITFHPHPRYVIKGKDDNNSLKLITSIQEKSDLLEKSGIEHLVIVPFSEEFSQQDPADYIQNFLVKLFHPKYIVIGYDHRFGKNRGGDISLLKKHEKKDGFKVVEIEKQTIEDIDISSSKIRKALENKDIQSANQLLGHSFILHGKIVEGKKVGRTIGYPTANIEIDDKDKLVPPFGIYAVWAFLGEKKYGGMLYIGDRPTVENGTNTTIEVNLFDFDEDIYGQYLWIEFVDFIRNDKKFDGLEALKMALMRDKIRAQYLLNPPH